MTKIEPFEKHASEYDGWFENNRFVYESEFHRVATFYSVSEVDRHLKDAGFKNLFYDVSESLGLSMRINAPGALYL